MRNPYASFDPSVVPPVAENPRTSTHEGRQGPVGGGSTDSRSFAELLADAEAVRDRIEVQHMHSAAPRTAPWRAALDSNVHAVVQGTLQGAVQLLNRQAPWLGLPLLLRGTRKRGA